MSMKQSNMEALLNEDGLSLKTVANPVLGVTVSSRQRQLIIKPRDVQWSWLPKPGQNASSLPPLQLQMSLPAGSYATCALRELSRRPVRVWT